jgi:predicted phosphodiesterase
MPIAALYDIHGNLPALRAVLADATRQGVDAFVIGGDVAAGPLPSETIDQLIALNAHARYVRGNADREVVDAYDAGLTSVGAEQDPARRAAAFAAARISPTQRDFLAAFAPTVEVHLEGLGPTLFCHGSPRNDAEIITRITPDDRVVEILEGLDPAVVVCGHTHQQFDRRVARGRIVNAGSVGAPYEGRPGAYWALLAPDVEVRRTEYDLEQALEELRAGGFPDLDEMLRESLLDPADPDEVAEFFERQAETGS